MILDLESFISRERPHWDELESTVAREAFNARGEDGEEFLKRIRRFHYLYKRASADLAKLRTFASEPELTRYLEDLIAQAYTRLHGSAGSRGRFRPFHWLLRTYPRAFRRHSRAFWLSLAVSMSGATFGAFVISQNVENKMRLLPAQFGHLVQSPTERVQMEEDAARSGPRLDKNYATFSAQLMNNNIRVAIRAMAWGILFGIFTIGLLFYNGVILGVVGYEYVVDGQGEFLAGWLLPHGVPELTAIFMGGQCGLILARAMIGWGTNLGLRARFRAIRSDLATLVIGFVLLLIWAGIVESYMSQHHEPAIPYPFKIAFGVTELVFMAAFLVLSGRGEDDVEDKVESDAYESGAGYSAAGTGATN